MLAATHQTVQTLWEKERIRDTVWKAYSIPVGSTTITLYFANHNEDATRLTVWAETPIGRIPVHNSSLDDRLGTTRSGYRTIAIVATRLLLELRPVHSEGEPVVSLAIDAA